jgi:hypothetical protein
MSEQNKTLARRWFEDLFSRGDLDAANEILSAEFVDHLTHEDERASKSSSTTSAFTAAPFQTSKIQ